MQLDESISLDTFKYTAWRKVMGKAYGIYIDVLLIISDASGTNALYTLNGRKVTFDQLGRSDRVIDKKYLAICDGGV